MADALTATENAQRIPGRVDRITAGMERNEWGLNIQLIGINEESRSPEGVTLAQSLGYLGLMVATVLGMRVLVAVSRDRVI
jgi:hypothetical protein